MNKSPENGNQSRPKADRLSPRVRKGLRAGAAALALVLLASACDSDPTPQTPSAATVEKPAETPSTPEGASMQEAAAGQVHYWANKIVSLINNPTDEMRGKITVVSGTVGNKSGGDVDTTLSIEAGTLVSGDSGVYRMTVTGPEKGTTGTVDPDSAYSVYITMDTQSATDDQNSTKRGELYALHAFRNPDTNDWRFISHIENKGIVDIDSFFLTESFDPNKVSPNVRALAPESLNYLAEQAQIVFDWAQDVAPVNVVPYK